MTALVSIVKAGSYDAEVIENALRKSIDSLGGIGKFVKPGATVHIKPNIVMAKGPATAVAIHPEIIRALGRMIKAAGARAIIAESPGGPYMPETLRAAYAFSGIGKAAQETDIELNYDTSYQRKKNPQGKYLKTVDIITPLADSSCIINVCKLKTHGQMVYSGAVKNMFGAVPGTLKLEQHMRLSEYDQFADGLIDVFLSVKPVLNIMDAVLSMEGYGPTAGNPRQTGLILASEDAFALDSAAVAIVGINPADVPVLKQGRERNLAPANLSSIEFPDEKPEAVKVPDFKIPQLDKLLTIQFVRAYPFLQFLMESFRPRPVFTNRCVKCGECAELCPAKVLTMGKNGPSVNLKKCIRCFCCQELCRVKAVEIKRRFLARAALAAMQGVMLAVKPFLRRLKY